MLKEATDEQYEKLEERVYTLDDLKDAFEAGFKGGTLETLRNHTDEVSNYEYHKSIINFREYLAANFILS